MTEAQKKAKRAALDNMSGHKSAWNKLDYQKRIGNIKPARRCSVCGKTGDMDFHHPNYNDPENGKWVCKSCNQKERANQTEKR